MSCELNILRLTETIKKKIQDRGQKHLWTLYVDLKSAFDTVDHDILFNKMRELNIDNNVIETIIWLYNQTKI